MALQRDMPKFAARAPTTGLATRKEREAPRAQLQHQLEATDYKGEGSPLHPEGVYASRTNPRTWKYSPEMAVQADRDVPARISSGQGPTGNRMASPSYPVGMVQSRRDPARERRQQYVGGKPSAVSYVRDFTPFNPLNIPYLSILYIFTFVFRI